ncbi:lytic transglycosylase domain-containing protein [Methylocapsa palsarum]|uniref:Soluble lytic murein transglycosylase n=1 Tax=Methylocapsa palsarum TaxID=1612308 RepID=A0A1I4B2X6_9HYPH|nr:lytic transglycosylase domain-containing protein [Methylocapsa palsarum]SFK62249.1 soluble lytic murein transglycosylase [Methylocapsa palsarum]
MLSRDLSFWLKAATGVVLTGVCAAWIHESGPDWGLFASNEDQAVVSSGLDPDAFESPYLQEDDAPDDDPLRQRRKTGNASALLSDRALSQQFDIDATGLAEAIAAYKSADLARGDNAARSAKDPTVQTALEWIALRTFPREAGFARIQAFINAHPSWPALGWLHKRSEEALFGDRKNAPLIKTFFSNARPETPAGKLALAKVLTDEGKTAEAATLVRDVWRESDLNATLETKVKSDFISYLDRADHKFRADRLLYKEETANALRAAALAGPDVVALAKARAAVIAETNSDKLLAAVPVSLRADPAFLFAQIQKLRRAEKFREAVDVMLSAPKDPALLVDGDDWWVERRLLARKMLDQNDAATAYKLCAEHSASSREMRIEAEFHAGWIALRFQNDPAKAAIHFEKLSQYAETPMSKARAAYWRGRAAEASASETAIAAANAFYQQAANQPTTYYGQLAREKLGLDIAPIREISNEAKGDAREESIKVVELLYGVGEKSLATPLAIEAIHNLQDDAQIAALARVVANQRDAHISLTVGKLASQRGVPLDTLAFPTYGVPSFEPLQNSAAPSLIYAIARQESAFNPTAISTAGAKGLMQMIASTARRTAQRAGVAFDENRLVADAAFNAQLAAAHLGELLAEQRGSYILTFAAYNAGGKRVKQWIDAYGDPRKPGVDAIDWIERIPFTETRNYVQRVSENLGIYRIRFGEEPTGIISREQIAKAQAKL